MDPLSLIGGIAAGIQLVETGATALLATVKLMKDLKDVPRRLLLLLNDVESSTSRLCYSCNAGSRLFRTLDPPQLDRLSRTAAALYPALQEIQRLLEPLVRDGRDRKTPVLRLWNSLLSLKLEKELVEKQKRLDRLSMELVRELGTINLEVQVETNGLVVASHATSVQNFIHIEDKIDSLRDEFQAFYSSVRQSHAVISEDQGKGARYDIRLGLNSSGQVHKEPLSPEWMAQLQGFLINKPLGHIPTEPVPSAVPNAQLEFILFNVRTYYTVANFNTGAAVQKEKLWSDTDLAIYLLKTTEGGQRGKSNSQTRAFRLLKSTTADAWDKMDLHTPRILIDLLSTLAPINTVTCPYVREALLEYLSVSARRQLPKGHPIAAVIDRLRHDNRDNGITLRTLTFIAERLQVTVGPSHELTVLAVKRLCALLRRSLEYAEALRVARESISRVRSALGTGSLQDRQLSRQLEHIYIDQQNWTAALDICFDIVGQQRRDSPNPDPRYHDECAVYTMEDIAKIFGCAGNFELAVAWLKQARISGGMLWGNEEALLHVQDKLAELLELTGKGDETELWQVVS